VLQKPFLFLKLFSIGMGFPYVSIILTFFLFTGVIGWNSVYIGYGQLSSPYANCVSMMMKGDFVQLNMDDDCNEAQWNEATQHYKANGYPNEESYMDMLGSKFIQLSSDKWVQDQADLDQYLKENK
jgi:hypothetical protein